MNQSKIKLCSAFLSGIVVTLFMSQAFAFTFDSNVPKNIQEQMVADVNFVNGIKGDKPSTLHKKIFGDIEGANYGNFFNKHIRSVGISGCGNPNAVACVIPYSASNKMWITQNYIKFSHPQIARLMVVFHEARHTENENGNWPHANCPEPFLDDKGNEMKSIWTGAPLAGEPACDDTEYGSYGSSTIMLKNISKYCLNCTEKVKMDAGIYADDQLGRITDATAKKSIQNDLY